MRLIALHPNVIVAITTPAIAAAQKATSTIPIIAPATCDLLSARPGKEGHRWYVRRPTGLKFNKVREPLSTEMCVKSFALVDSAVSFKLRYRAITTLLPGGAGKETPP
jgi:hypothetical protein